MKLDCDVIGDLLPLYTEQMVSDKSKELVEAHLAECPACRQRHAEMSNPDVQPAFSAEPAQHFRSYVKKEKWRLGLKVALITAAAVMTVVIIRLVMIGALIAFLALDSMLAPIEVDTDIANYSRHIGENADEKYRYKWGMDESIFPAAITDSMDVIEYKMVYYNPWDAQYLSYLTVSYDDADYAAELERLAAYPSTAYEGYYSVTGFDGGEPLAIYSDSYHGFIYAISTPKQENTITYVELIFCNYFYDLEYIEYIPIHYLPDGFNAQNDNPYQEKMREEIQY